LFARYDLLLKEMCVAFAGRRIVALTTHGRDGAVGATSLCLPCTECCFRRQFSDRRLSAV